MKKVLVINANPKNQSFCKSLANKYALEAALTHDVKLLHVSEMDFEISLDRGYDTSPVLEKDLLYFQELILWSEHIVIVTPVWWGTLPAKFKGLIDRVFLPNFAFKYVDGKAFPEKLLLGRSSELYITLDTPPFWYKYFKGNAIYKQLKKSILDFSGIKNHSATYFGPVVGSSSETRQKWLSKVSKQAGKLL
ncbi:NAD(P)H-dependent oxidoreductase [Vibrio sp. ZSDZ65]|uniref:NAD(P)H-dependent oxidoreductase n=1 Tax=Vibrio qingdaonensis TaxID=2829491 RepID=A0A9X3CTB1_9VIBR|nr:NAD(P)H-dependent oxidoreductase [Vibrio qingdaonensis]MCW8349287.1 NAD(P)H-dependent oxidoreductase [Vibrio qingdaonensis]